MTMLDAVSSKRRDPNILAYREFLKKPEAALLSPDVCLAFSQGALFAIAGDNEKEQDFKSRMLRFSRRGRSIFITAVREDTEPISIDEARA